MLCTITQVLSHPCSTSRWRLWPIMRSFLFPPSPHCPHHDPFHPSCICYNFPCPIYPTYLTWLSMPKCIGKTLMTIPFSSISLHVCSCIETLPRNRFCVTIWHYCLVLLFLALWPVLYEAATRIFSYSSLSIPPRYGRMPLWCVPLLISDLDQVSDHLQAVFLPFMDASIHVDRHWQSPSCG